MDMAWFRDLSITVMGFVTAAVLIFVAILIYRLYRELTKVLFIMQTLIKSINETVDIVEGVIKTTSQNINDAVAEMKDNIKLMSKGISDTVIRMHEGIKPLLPVLTFIEGIRDGFKRVSKIFKKESEGGNSHE